MRLLFLSALISAVTCFGSLAQSSPDPGPKVLIVTAHPDDDAMFAATVYRITHALEGAVDLALLTDGAGGYRFSVLAEEIYGLKLTDPEVARNYLPAIRKQELMAGGRIVGIRNYFFLDQPDQGKTENADSILTHVWDVEYVDARLDDILRRGSYDFVFTHLPIKPFHAHHKAATILALRAVERISQAERPVILGSFTTGGLVDVVNAFVELDGFPETRILKEHGPFVFDRGTRFGAENRLDYNIVVNWLIAEHKSQGTMQLFMGNSGVERFWVYAINGAEAVIRAAELMERVRTAPGPG